MILIISCFFFIAIIYFLVVILLRIDNLRSIRNLDFSFVVVLFLIFNTRFKEKKEVESAIQDVTQFISET